MMEILLKENQDAVIHDAARGKSLVICQDDSSNPGENVMHNHENLRSKADVQGKGVPESFYQEGANDLNGKNVDVGV